MCRACDRMVHMDRHLACPEKQLWTSAKCRAKRYSVAFSINQEDIHIPEFCPALGMKLARGLGRLCDASPSLDRLTPARGYVLGNIAVISYKANRMKSNGSRDELRGLLRWMDSVL